MIYNFVLINVFIKLTGTEDMTDLSFARNAPFLLRKLFSQLTRKVYILRFN